MQSVSTAWPHEIHDPRNTRRNRLARPADCPAAVRPKAPAEGKLVKVQVFEGSSHVATDVVTDATFASVRWTSLRGLNAPPIPAEERSSPPARAGPVRLSECRIDRRSAPLLALYSGGGRRPSCFWFFFFGGWAFVVALLLLGGKKKKKNAFARPPPLSCPPAPPPPPPPSVPPK